MWQCPAGIKEGGILWRSRLEGLKNGKHQLKAQEVSLSSNRQGTCPCQGKKTSPKYTFSKLWFTYEPSFASHLRVRALPASPHCPLSALPKVTAKSQQRTARPPSLYQGNKAKLQQSLNTPECFSLTMPCLLRGICHPSFFHCLCPGTP